MIRIFRNIRQQLAAQNKVAAYLRYAIGEIVLVVIGILIALQVNNWNEHRKERNEEVKMLIELKSDLMESRGELERADRANLKTIHLYKRLVAAMQQKKKYNTSLDSAFGSIPLWAAPYFTNSAYETLKSKGLDIISNDGLRTSITKFYNTDISILENDWNKWEWNINQQVVLPWFTKHCRYYSKYLAKPNNYKALVSHDEQLLNILGLLLRSRRYGINKCELMEHKIDHLVDQIDSELRNRGYNHKMG